MRKGSQVRIRTLLLLASVAIGGMALLAAPPVARAANGMVETGTTTYEVVPSRHAIDVTIQLSIANNSPNETTNGHVTYYYWNSTAILVPQSAGPVSVTSNAGPVSQSVQSTDQHYKVVKLRYADVYYRQTRVVTATFSIPAGPDTAGFRVGQAYASLCAVGNGEDSGSVAVVVPEDFNLRVLAGGELPTITETSGKRVFSSSTVAKPRTFVTCVEAMDPASMTHMSATADGQAFDLRGWPEDPMWSENVRAYISGDVGRLEDLTGLTMPGGVIVISESSSGTNDQGIWYDPASKTLSLPESASPSMIAHGLAHVWFNSTMFKDTWVSEGLAKYGERAAGEGSYTPCGYPGIYPGADAPNLLAWQALTFDSTVAAQNISDWQYGVSCYFFAALANAMGPDNFRSFLRAAAAGEMAYVGATPGEKPSGATLPLVSERVLDLLDERGMVPAGIADLDQAQKMLSDWGVFDAATLVARSHSRAAYHSLAAAAGAWKLPLAVRGPMSSWDFDSADAAMAIARQILDARDETESQMPGFSLDGTEVQTRFESAATEADLNNLADLMKTVAGASDKVARATKMRDAGTNVIQTIGLLGADVDATITQARAHLGDLKPDQADREAQSAIDQMDGSLWQGLLRGLVAVGLVALMTLAVVFWRRRWSAAAAGSSGGGAASVGLEGPGTDEGAPPSRTSSETGERGGAESPPADAPGQPPADAAATVTPPGPEATPPGPEATPPGPEATPPSAESPG
jgi:hypothetical protein